MEISRTEPLGTENAPRVAKQLKSKVYPNQRLHARGALRKKESQDLGENKEMECRLRGQWKETIGKTLAEKVEK